MTNEEMMRPCALPAHWNQKTFDAMKVNDIVYGMQTVQIRMPHGVICYQANTGLHPTGDRLLQLYREAITTISDALNAPVLATDAVLAGLPKDANAVLIDDAGIPYSLDWVSRTGIGDGWAWGDDYDVMPYHKIQAFRCPKTADYLRQFTLDGVRRVG
jgi:hypothetical protein